MSVDQSLLLIGPLQVSSRLGLLQRQFTHTFKSDLLFIKGIPRIGCTCVAIAGNRSLCCVFDEWNIIPQLRQLNS